MVKGRLWLLQQGWQKTWPALFGHITFRGSETMPVAYLQEMRFYLFPFQLYRQIILFQWESPRTLTFLVVSRWKGLVLLKVAILMSRNTYVPKGWIWDSLGFVILLNVNWGLISWAIGRWQFQNVETWVLALRGLWGCKNTDQINGNW